MFHAQRFYWILLHTSMRRLYAITFCIIILCFSIWFYFWYKPLNHAIQKLMISSINNTADVNINVNITTGCQSDSDDAQQLSRVAVCAEHSGVQMRRVCSQNNQQINFEGKGTVAQFVSFFQLLEKDHQPLHCVQMNMHKDCADLFIVQMQLA